jgi:hypothetical protein
LKWLSQNELICFGNHTIHKVGCIEQRGRALMRLENKNFTGFHWVVVSWREAIDAAMLAAGIKPASVDTVTMEEINEAYSKAFSIEFMRSDVHQGRSAGLRAVLALVKPGVKVVG